MKKWIWYGLLGIALVFAGLILASYSGSSGYESCVENGGTVINKGQCVLESQVFLEGKTESINLEECDSYYDGCNTCFIVDGKIGGCTLMACSPEMMKEPQCMKEIVDKIPAAKEGEMCGGIAGILCEDGYTCKMEGDYPDASGTCVLETPRICTADYNPVCGVDGKTYSNKCMAGDVVVAYNGECQDLSECSSFFDGCNTCFVTDGVIGGCTRKYCSPEMMEQPKCLE